MNLQASNLIYKLTRAHWISSCSCSFHSFGGILEIIEIAPQKKIFLITIFEPFCGHRFKQTFNCNQLPSKNLFGLEIVWTT